MISSRPFGRLPTGETVEAWTLRGEGGLELEVLSYGGIVTRLLAPGRDGRRDDVVLGCGSLEGYVGRHPYFGAIIGRVAGRISGGRFELDGRVVQLERNDPPNHLHGGAAGFDRRCWAVAPVARSDGVPAIRLSRLSPDGEEGYPGAVQVAVTYVVTADNALRIESEAESDRPTPFSLTHHSYFNLAGEGSGPVTGHRLWIDSDGFVPTDDRLTLLGRWEPVTADNDFRTGRVVGEAIPRLHLGHGDLYRVRRTGAEPGGLCPVARLEEPRSGRVLTVHTTEDCLQFYTGAGFDGSLTGKSGRPYGPHAGLCLECEGCPDAIGRPHLGDIVLRPGRRLRHSTVYAFSIATGATQAGDHL